MSNHRYDYPRHPDKCFWCLSLDGNSYDHPVSPTDGIAYYFFSNFLAHISLPIVTLLQFIPLGRNLLWFLTSLILVLQKQLLHSIWECFYVCAPIYLSICLVNLKYILIILTFKYFLASTILIFLGFVCLFNVFSFSL